MELGAVLLMLTNTILTHAVEAFAQGSGSPMDSSTCAHGGCIVLSDQVEDGLTGFILEN